METPDPQGKVMPYADRITIGIPAFNESRHIGNALASAAGQSRHIIVSDNASDDDTAKICALVATRDSNIELIRHPENIGSASNFRFLLDQCQTEYFMWLGAHDQIPPGYTRTLIAILDDHHNAIMAYGDAKHIDLAGNPVRTETYPLLKYHLASSRRETRMLAIVRHLSDCTMIHGVWRTEELRRSWVEEKYLGVDHVVLFNASSNGQLLHTEATYLLRGNPRLSDNRTNQLQRLAGGKNKKSPTYLEMYRTQLRIIYAALGIRSCLTAGIVILGRLGAFNVKSYLKLLGLTAK
jgi:glycosyltransferase involved in cell wall biosynthesis